MKPTREQFREAQAAARQRKRMVMIPSKDMKTGDRVTFPGSKTTYVRTENGPLKRV